MEIEDVTSPGSLIGALVAIPVGAKLCHVLYNEMTPSVDADASGAIGVVVFPIGAMVVTFLVVGTFANCCWKWWQNFQ